MDKIKVELLDSRDAILKAQAEGTLDELCNCGHLRSEHRGAKTGNQELDEALAGHGSCTRCECEKYRFKAFVKVDRGEKVGCEA